MRGFLLAGGLSRRFGSDKALFLIEGVPMVQRLAHTLSEAGLEPWIIARSSRNLGIRELIEPPQKSHHPLWGVFWGLQQGETALFCPCDLADLRPAQVRTMVEAGEGSYARGQPLLGVWGPTLAEKAALLAEKGSPVREFVAGMVAVEVGEIGNWNRAGG